MRRDQNGDGDFDDANEQIYYLHDDMYNVTAITDASGNVLERYDYLDYGAPQIYDATGSLKSVSSSDYGNPYLFNSRRYDPETGLYHYRTRYLDPAMGRFTTRDTIGIWGDILELGNGYTYWITGTPYLILDFYGVTRTSLLGPASP